MSVHQLPARPKRPEKVTLPKPAPTTVAAAVAMAGLGLAWSVFAVGVASGGMRTLRRSAEVGRQAQYPARDFLAFDGAMAIAAGVVLLALSAGSVLLGLLVFRRFDVFRRVAIVAFSVFALFSLLAITGERRTELRTPNGTTFPVKERVDATLPTISSLVDLAVVGLLIVPMTRRDARKADDIRYAVRA